MTFLAFIQTFAHSLQYPRYTAILAKTPRSQHLSQKAEE